ncbi:hypothetical protein [Novosphingobium album (ex Liu et al. 2023)]|uniref:Uncharacterized protein n=1 Tax=Novosphingobium album (ex Liu et al. 2023) TaxID=3031130 RepID=A0ABT5WY52_9SPHN|nr:hypothetical protein [Novosphingobium album (ex Liu et al. 2023)]MDE8654801.1 hypothetical protein [Novosphingobium album (ex Liu et al. 2023)]
MRWFLNLGRRCGKTAANAPGDSPDEWRAGDLAECLNANGWFRNGIYPDHGPACGDVRIVQVVEIAAHLLAGEPTIVLEFARWPRKLYPAYCFRKITPRADAAERADPAFVADLRAQPAREKEDA